MSNSKQKGKTTIALMKHIRKNHKIHIEGTKDKKDLLNMGYYHGYKRYRFIRSRSQTQPFVEFSQIKAIHEFDMELKTLIYPLLMKLETCLKNKMIDCLVSNSNHDIESIYREKMLGYQDYEQGTPDYTKRLRERLKLRNMIDQTIAYYYEKNPAITHFIHNSRSIPLWAFVESLSLGQFGEMLKPLSKDHRLKICRSVNLESSSYNEDGRLLESFVFALTDLRNATMHNGPVFDASYRQDGVPRRIKRYVVNETGMESITFNSILDDILVLLFLLKKQGYKKRELSKALTMFKELKEQLKSKIPDSTYYSLLGNNTDSKIKDFTDFL